MLTENQKIKAVIFDLGNVLIDFNHRIAAEKISRFTDKNPEGIFNLFFDSPLTASFEEGKITTQQFFCEVKNILNLNIGYEKFVSIWNDIFFITEKNTEVYKLACALKTRYKLALLSNINALHLQYIKEKFSYLDAFHNLIASCELGTKKPQELIYRKTLEIMKVKANEAFYTDDREELIESAEKLGIKAFVFKGVEQLREDLLGIGVNTN